MRQAMRGPLFGASHGPPAAPAAPAKRGARVERERARVSETREIIIAKIEIGECSDDTRKTRNYAVTGMAYVAYA